VISHTVGDIEAVLEATNDPNGETLEKQIRKMVVASLKGQDQEAAARMAEKSIEDAKKLIELNQAEMDQTLGSGNEGDETDIPMPSLKPALPSISCVEFVLRALASEGASVTDLGDGLYTARSAGLGEEKFTFDEKVVQRFTQTEIFMGRTPLLYQPGKPAFERLVQRWIDRSAARITDSRKTDQEIHQIADNWLKTIPESILVTAIANTLEQSLVENVLCRTRVSNAVDSYEKLICVPYKSNSSYSAKRVDLAMAVRVKSLLPEMDTAISKHVLEHQPSMPVGIYDGGVETLGVLDACVLRGHPEAEGLPSHA